MAVRDEEIHLEGGLLLILGRNETLTLVALQLSGHPEARLVEWRKGHPLHFSSFTTRPTAFSSTNFIFFPDERISVPVDPEIRSARWLLDRLAEAKCRHVSEISEALGPGRD